MTKLDPSLPHPYPTQTQTPPAVSIKVHLPLSLKHQLQNLAAARNVSMSALIRLILLEYLKHQGGL